MNQQVNIIERWRFAHHNVAMMFAAGLTIQEVEKRTGFTRRRLVLLLDDPTFNELIQHYREPYVRSMEKAIANAAEMMTFAHSGSLRQICDYIEDADEPGADKLPLNMLLKIHDTMADRIGLSKHTVKTNVNINFAAELDRCIERADKVRLIEGEVSNRVISAPKTFRRA
jgi:hypothetical protein